MNRIKTKNKGRLDWHHLHQLVMVTSALTIASKIYDKKKINNQLNKNQESTWLKCTNIGRAGKHKEASRNICVHY